MKFKIICNGCIRRSFEAYKIEKWLFENDQQVRCIFINSEDTEQDDSFIADVIIYVSCAFNKTREYQVKDFLKNCKDLSKIILVGCFFDIVSSYDFSGVRLVSSLDNFIEQLDNEFNFSLKLRDVKDASMPLPMIPIAAGCLNNCSYCGIKSATKGLRSRPLVEIEKEIQLMIEKSSQDKISIRFTSEDTGCWGQDINSSFSDFLDALMKYECVFSMGNMDVYWFMKYYDQIEKAVFSGCISQMILGVQHFSQETLKSMNRRSFDVDLLEERVKRLNAHSSFTCFMFFMYNFPTETREQFNLLVGGIKKYQKINVNTCIFRFHRKENFKMDVPELSDEEKGYRDAEILKIQEINCENRKNLKINVAEEIK